MNLAPKDCHDYESTPLRHYVTTDNAGMEMRILARSPEGACNVLRGMFAWAGDVKARLETPEERAERIRHEFEHAVAYQDRRSD